MPGSCKVVAGHASSFTARYVAPSTAKTQDWAAPSAAQHSICLSAEILLLLLDKHRNMSVSLQVSICASRTCGWRPDLCKSFNLERIALCLAKCLLRLFGSLATQMLHRQMLVGACLMAAYKGLHFPARVRASDSGLHLFIQ